MNWRYVISTLCLLGVSVYSQGPYNLNYNPRGNLPETGRVSFGLDYSNYYLNEELSSQIEYDFSYAFSDFLTYGLTGDGTGFAHSVYAVLFQAPSHEGNVHHYITGGVQNIGGSSLVNEELIKSDLFFEYTADILSHKTEYHFGMMRDMVDHTEYYPFFGTMHKFDLVNVGFEMNGRSAGLVLDYHPVPDVSYLLQFSQSLLDEDDEDYATTPEQLFTVGLRINGNIFEAFRESMVSKQEMKKEMDYLHARLNILDAKERALSDMSSLDMLDSLEQALMNRNVIDDELDSQTKNLVKGALSHMQRGLEFYYQEKYKSALEEYKIVISLLPNSYIGHLRMGSIYFQLDDSINAKKHWKLALQLNPNNEALRTYIENLINPPTSEKEGESASEVMIPQDAILMDDVSNEHDQESLLLNSAELKNKGMNYREFEQELFQLKDYQDEN